MRDFLPSDVRKRNYVIGIIKEVYESYGFEPLETPAVENLDTLMGKYGDEGNQLIFKVLKRGEKLSETLESIIKEASLESKIYDATLEGKLSPRLVNPVADLALRYDLTVPLARVVANNKNELPKFFKRYQIQPVWRADRPARGRFREFYQCDVDCIGSTSMVVEAELISAVMEILKRLRFGDFVVRVNHRDILNGVLMSFGIDRGYHLQILMAIDKLDKVGVSGVLDLLSPLKNLPNFEQLEIFLEDYSSINEDQTLTSVMKTVEKHSSARDAVSGLQKLLQAISDSNTKFDIGLVRGLSYYTGTIMEINVPDLAGSLGGGGRYDGLIGMFGKEQIPACGFSLGLERILVVMDERGMFPPEIAASTPADVMVTIWNEETVAESLKLASELRAAGLRVTVYPEPDKLGKQLKYADSIKVPWVCVLSESEIADNKVTLKNMKTGEQETVEQHTIVTIIKSI